MKFALLGGLIKRRVCAFDQKFIESNPRAFMQMLHNSEEAWIFYLFINIPSKRNPAVETLQQSHRWQWYGEDQNDATAITEPKLKLA
jgi:hypothetical protein